MCAQSELIIRSIFDFGHVFASAFLQSGYYLTYFMPLVSFYTPWKQKISGIELDQIAGNGFRINFHKKVFVFSQTRN